MLNAHKANTNISDPQTMKKENEGGGEEGRDGNIGLLAYCDYKGRGGYKYP